LIKTKAKALLIEQIVRREKLMHVEIQDLGELLIFNDIDASLAAFHTGDEGLVFAQGFSQVGLAHACGMTLGREKRDKRSMA